MSLLCATISESTPESISKQIHLASQFADLLEFRLDKMFPHSKGSIESIDFNSLRKFRELAPIPVIINYPYRDYFHSLSDYITLIKILALLRPEYLDIDITVPEYPTSRILRPYSKTKIIRSTHLDHTDLSLVSLPDVYASMKKHFSAYLYKIVVETDSTLDTLNLYSQSLTLGKDLIFLCSGIKGTASRILSPVKENPINYSHVTGYPPVAKGQLSTKELLRYNYRFLNKHSSIFALVGDPVKNSIGHVIHNYFLSKKQINSCYLKLNTPLENLEDTLQIIKTLPFKGLSVTAPLKSAILPFVDFPSSFVKKVGAANTLVIKKGYVYAFNTDGVGCLRALQRLNIPLKKVAILGFGGSGRAIALALALNGSKVSVYNRTTDKFSHLIKEHSIQIFSLKKLDSPETTYDLLISTLPPKVAINIPLKIARCFMDLSTLPKKTPHIISAQQQGIPVIHGYQMFVEQALDQIRLWFPNTLSLGFNRMLFKKTERTLFFT
ncbi:shikimate dehydrogenase [Chlamydiifrater volucris]|uniref:shikimate dehydrogenase n=1 Tax=Chlamydiifrater volucris TaxID=2681470 RepID=UPI001BCC2E8E|nr:shikimate dehydrogenase [Chlamydiifrater volucris]